LVVEVAGKGARAIITLTLGVVILCASVFYLVSCIASGYYLKGTYGALVIPMLLLNVSYLWSLRKLVRRIFSPQPLISLVDGSLSYVAVGHASFRIADVGCYEVKGRTFPSLIFYEAYSKNELRRFPLFLSATPQGEVIQRLERLGLVRCKPIDR
jgi:hypothetical protein